MKENYITKVIHSFFRKDYSEDTQKKVQRWLIEEEYLKEKEDALFELWENNQILIDKEARQALVQTKTHLGLKQKKGMMFYLGNLKVASVLLLLIVSVSIYYFYNPTTATLTYSTLEGEIKNIELPDGTQIRLKEASSVTYQPNNRENKRILDLSGEAWFEVSPDSLNPFIVRTNRLSVEVIGTAFNIEDYADTLRAVVTLHTGRIKIEITDSNRENHFYYPEPGEQFIYDPLSGTEISKPELSFPDTSFENIIKKLESHFNVKINIHNFENREDYYSVKFIHGESLEQIMNILQGVAGNFTYEIIH